MIGLYNTMTDEDLINLQYDVGRHEGDLDRHLKQIQELERQVSELKKDNAELTASLKKTVLLVQENSRLLNVPDKFSRTPEEACVFRLGANSFGGSGVSSGFPCAGAQATVSHARDTNTAVQRSR